MTKLRIFLDLLNFKTEIYSKHLGYLLVSFGSFANINFIYAIRYCVSVHVCIYCMWRVCFLNTITQEVYTIVSSILGMWILLIECKTLLFFVMKVKGHLRSPKFHPRCRSKFVSTIVNRRLLSFLLKSVLHSIVFCLIFDGLRNINKIFFILSISPTSLT